MTISIAAPWPDATTIIFLPSPAMGDSEASAHDVQLKQMLSGDYRTHARTTVGATYTWDFGITRKKALEFADFFRSFAGKLWQVTLWDDRVLVGNALFNPAEMRMLSRGVVAGSTETVGLSMTFRTIQ